MRGKAASALYVTLKLKARTGSVNSPADGKRWKSYRTTPATVRSYTDSGSTRPVPWISVKVKHLEEVKKLMEAPSTFCTDMEMPSKPSDTETQPPVNSRALGAEGRFGVTGLVITQVPLLGACGIKEGGKRLRSAGVWV